MDAAIVLPADRPQTGNCAWTGASALAVTNEQLRHEAASLRDAVQAGNPSALLRALDAALKSRCLERTHPVALETRGDLDASLTFASAFATTLEALPLHPPDAVTSLRQQCLIATARQLAGRSALMLSGGGALGNHHLGVLRALLSEGLLPDVISGASAGALFAAIVGTHTDEELGRLFSGGAPAFASPFGPQKLDDLRLRQLIDGLVPDVTFAEAYRGNGRAINIVVSARRGPDQGLVLNAKATPDVLLRGAVHASCAVPFLFEPVALERRNSAGQVGPFRSGERWIDGSIFADLPILALADVYGVDRSIASMVNPLVLPFVTHPHEQGAMQHWLARLGIDAFKLAAGQGFEMVIPLVEQWPAASLTLETWHRVVRQSYRADVMITPRQRLHNPQTLTDLVGAEALRSYVEEGERTTLARIDIIRAAISIEQALHRFD